MAFTSLSNLLFLSTIVLSLSASIHASYVFTFPPVGQTLSLGQSYNVTWETQVDDIPIEPLVDVLLSHGEPGNLTIDYAICTNVPSSSQSCFYTPSADSPSGQDYAFIVGKAQPSYAYSNYFALNSTGPLPDNIGCPAMGGHNCTESLPCCSSNGYCGSSVDYCGVGCLPQFSFNGVCLAPSPSPSSSTPGASPTTSSTPPPDASSTPPPDASSPSSPPPTSSTPPPDASSPSSPPPTPPANPNARFVKKAFRFKRN
ncbi:8878_t:CDS:2 [Paraglomus brasilianum]|uniref:8878_t:CDS:1 n=1 Tax=Paraglomus brasilianum TaxID=144538 RepID=A0A9N8W3B6_9GLOM|nr:8878_t:CDS:2 [Paraglomus brasilianum]